MYNVRDYCLVNISARETKLPLSDIPCKQNTFLASNFTLDQNIRRITEGSTDLFLDSVFKYIRVIKAGTTDNSNLKI
jgi:hypothetical protein